MTKAPAIAQWTARVTGVLQLLMGLVIWTGAADQLVPVHIALGVLLVIALWALAALAVGKAPVWQVGLAFAWGLLMPALGLTQANLLPDGFHWTIQVLHLVIGVAAIGQAESLAGAIRSGGGGRGAREPVASR